MPGDNWVEKHRPETYDDVQGNTKALKQIERWANNWEVGDEAILLYGEPGTGKTSTAYIVANDIGAPLNQINASSARKSADLQDIADEATMTPIDEDLQVVLLDEVDSWSASADAEPIIDMLDNPRNPIIMTANEDWEIPNSIRNHSNVEDYNFTLGIRSRKAKIKEIAKREDIDLADDDLEMLSQRPDLRSAINDLQMLESGGEIDDDGRSWAVDEWSAMRQLVMGNADPISRLDPEDMVVWADQNLPGEYEGLEMALAADLLSEADVNLGRIWQMQYPQYRYKKFAGALLETTADMRLTETPKEHWIDLEFPKWFRVKKPENQYSGAHELYQALKDHEDGSYQFSSNFTYFLQVILPILEEQPLEKRCRIVLNNDLDSKARNALNVSEKQYEEWVEEEEPETGEWEPPSKDALEW